jgi:hypothetical protein
MDVNLERMIVHVPEKATNFIADTKTRDLKQATRWNEIEGRFNEARRKIQLRQIYPDMDIHCDTSTRYQ